MVEPEISPSLPKPNLRLGRPYPTALFFFVQMAGQAKVTKGIK